MTPVQHKSISKSALLTFVSLSAVVYFSAISYCIATGRMFELGLVTGASLVVTAFAAYTYKNL